MKQHITVEQLNELSEKDLLKYKDWCISKSYENRKDGVDLLSIGQMIEFLGEKKDSLTIMPIIGLILGDDKSQRQLSKIDLDNLCDSLWEAVKEVLND